jgi:protein subunit release factor B
MTRSTAPQPPSDRCVFVEVRAAQGVASPVEAMDFADEVNRLILRLADEQGWRVEIADLEPGDDAGIRRATLEIVGGPPVFRAV